MLHCRLMKFALVCLGWWAAMGRCAAWAEPAVTRKFNGPEKAWQLMSGPAPAQILAQGFAQGGRARYYGL